MAFVEEYLYILKPTIDNAAFEQAKGSLSKMFEKQTDKTKAFFDLKSNIKEQEEGLANLTRDIRILHELAKKTGDIRYSEKADALESDSETGVVARTLQLEKSKSELEILEKTTSKMNIAMAQGLKVFTKVASGVSMLVTLFKEAYDKLEEILDKGKEISNAFVSRSSVFVDKNIKSLMATTGTSAEQAQSLQASMEALGIEMEDLATLTDGQRKRLHEFYEMYNEGLASIDPDKMKEYNKNMQEYQLLQAKFDMQMRLAIIKLFAESDTLGNAMDAMSTFMGNLVDLLTSPAAQFAFDTTISFFTALINMLNAILVPINALMGNNGTTNNITVNSNTTNYGRADSVNYRSGADIIAEQIQSALRG